MGISTIVVTIGVSVAITMWAILDLVFSEERRVARRLEALSEFDRRSAADVEPLSRPFAQRVLGPAAGTAGRVLRGITPRAYREQLQFKARAAGFPGGVDGDTMVVIKVVSSLTTVAIVSIASIWAADNVARGLGFALILGVFAWILPDLWLSGRVTNRQDTIRRELPDMLDMLTIAVEAGLGFDAAVTKYVRNRTGPLSEEFALALREIQAGLARREALRNLSERCDVFELSAFVMAMVQADVFGVSVGSVLRVQSREIRVKRRQHAEELAQKAPAKMVFPLVLCILPATLIVLMTPAVISIGRAFGMLE